MTNVSDAIPLEAWNDRNNYELPTAPSGFGGQAEVFRATFRPTGETVAFKRFSQSLCPRGRREVEFLMKLEHPNIMPIMGSNIQGRTIWYTMPWAEGTLFDKLQELDPSTIAPVFEQICAGLGELHKSELVHRDLSPGNIYLLQSGAWVIGDLGMISRPQGTTTGRWTKTGKPLGTEGFMAPEMYTNPHSATPAADFYSLGQLIGWGLTQNWPLPNKPQIPNGAWGGLVRWLTAEDPSSRPQSIDSILQFYQSQIRRSPAPGNPDWLLKQVRSHPRDFQFLEQFIQTCLEGDENTLYDFLTKLRDSEVSVLVQGRSNLTHDAVKALTSALENSDSWGKRSFQYYEQQLLFLFNVAQAAVESSDLELLWLASRNLFKTDASLIRYSQRRLTRDWLNRLTGDAAEIVAQTLAIHQEAVEWYLEEGWNPTHHCDQRIKAVFTTTRADLKTKRSQASEWDF